MITRVFLLAVASTLWICTASAQTASGPVAGGDRLQPTQQQIDRRENAQVGRRNPAAQPNVDPLYDEIIRAATPPARSSSQ